MFNSLLVQSHIFARAEEQAHGTVLLQAVADRDAGLLRTALASGETWIFPSPGQQLAGSAIGLCVSHGWIEGLLVCQEAGLNPNRNATARDPLLWAYSNDDLEMAAILLDMGLDPLGPFIDTRSSGIRRRPHDLLTPTRLEIMSAADDVGELDMLVLSQQLSLGDATLRPRIGSILINNSRANSIAFHQLVLKRYPLLPANEHLIFCLRHGIERIVEQQQLRDREGRDRDDQEMAHAIAVSTMYGQPGLVNSIDGDWTLPWDGLPPSPNRGHLWVLPKQQAGATPMQVSWTGETWNCGDETGSSFVPSEATQAWHPLADFWEAFHLAWERERASDGPDGPVREVDPSTWSQMMATSALQIAVAKNRLPSTAVAGGAQ